MEGHFQCSMCYDMRTYNQLQIRTVKEEKKTLMARDRRLHDAGDVLAIWCLLGKKLAEGQETADQVGEKITQRPYKKKDGISDLMSVKNKDNFQIYETYVAIKAEHEH